MAEPDRVIAKFQKRVQQILKDYDELSLALYGKRREASLQTLIAEQCVMSQAVFWEGFVHELILSHLCNKQETYLSDLRNRVNQSISTRYPNGAKWIKVTVPTQLSRGQLLALVDPKGWNITAGTAQELAELANKMLPGAQAKKFSLNADDRSFIDLLVALRNYLGHRSRGSMKTLRACVSALDQGGQNAHLYGPIAQVGSYLKKEPVRGAHRRVTVIGNRLIQISNGFR